MKKALKLVWMVLFALPMISLTACGDDDDLVDNETGATVNMKDYSDLLDKTKEDVSKKMGIEVADQDEEGLYYVGISENVLGVSVLYSFGDFDENNVLKTYGKSVMVDVILDGYNYDTVYNFVTDKYGKGEMIEGMLVIKKGDMYVWYTWNDEQDWAEISYVKKSTWDKEFGELTKADGTLDINKIKAVKAYAATKRI